MYRYPRSLFLHLVFGAYVINNFSVATIFNMIIIIYTSGILYAVYFVISSNKKPSILRERNGETNCKLLLNFNKLQFVSKAQKKNSKNPVINHQTNI